MSDGTDPVALLQELIRIRTVNPPGDEGRCVEFLRRLFDSHGIETTILGEPERANLIVRIPGRGVAPGLLMHAHSDVVGVTNQQWTHPPFDAEIVDGEVWGRGAIDMKGGLAMMVAALLRMRISGDEPPGDVVLAVVADEEHGSTVGAKFLVERYPELFAGLRYAIGEEAGADITVPGRRIHPIVVAEKRAAWLRATFRGPGGHGSRLTPSTSPMAALGRMLHALTANWLPEHPVPATDLMLAALSREVDLDSLDDGDRLFLESVRRHTVNPTIVRAGDKINMLPAEITVDLDGRLLPGPYTVADFEAELRALIGPEAELELLLEGEPVPAEMPEPQLGPFYQLLATILREADPDGLPLPMVSGASTDARLFAQLGIRCYGWLPLLLPPGSGHRRLLHAADERVPVAAIEFGTGCLSRLLREFG